MWTVGAKTGNEDKVSRINEGNNENLNIYICICGCVVVVVIVKRQSTRLYTMYIIGHTWELKIALFDSLNSLSLCLYFARVLLFIAGCYSIVVIFYAQVVYCHHSPSFLHFFFSLFLHYFTIELHLIKCWEVFVVQTHIHIEIHGLKSNGHCNSNTIIQWTK